MVGGRVDGRQLVETGGETTSDVSGEHTACSGCVQTLEEGELLGIGDGGLINGGELLDDDVGMALDLTLAVEDLRGGEVIFLGIDEESSLHVLNGHRDGESSVGLDSSEILGESEFGGGHVLGRGDGTDRGGVAGAGGDLFPVGDGEVGHGQAEVDEVVRGRERFYLTGSWYILAVIGETISNDSGVES